METEADLPEPLALTKREGEIVYPASGYFDNTAYETSPGELKKLQGALHVPPETVEYSGETKNMHAASDVGADAMNTVIKVDVETPESERFLGSPLAVQVSNEYTHRVSKNSEPEEVTLQTGNETLEDGKQMQNNNNMEVAGEVGTEENKVTEDSEKKPDDNVSHGNVNLTGTSLQTTQVEESNIMTEEESLKEERIFDHVEVVGDQHVLVEDKSNEKEKSDPHNYEKDGTTTTSNEQVVNILEAKSDHNKDDLIHIPVPKVISLNKSVESVVEPCNKAESTIEGKSVEEMRETSSTEVENKAEKSSILTNEVPEETKPSERVADEKDEKEQSMSEGAEDIVMSTTDIQSNEEAPLVIRLGDNETLDKQSVTLATDVSGVYEAESEAAEKLKETSSILCEEKSTDETETSKAERNHENSIDIHAMQTEVKEIINNSPHEVKEQIEMTEKTAANDSTSNETGKGYESPDQKGDGLFVKDEDALSVNDVLPEKVASSGGTIYEEESTVNATKDIITDTEIIDAFEHSQSGITNHEDRSENLKQDKPEKEKLEGSLNVVAEVVNKAAKAEYAEVITFFKEETPLKSHKESLEKEMKSGLPHHTDADVPEIELNEKTKCAEAEAPNKNSNDLHDIQALYDEARQTDGKNLDEVFNSEPKGTSQEVHKEEEKHIKDAPEACQSSNSTIFEHTYIEGAESTELIHKAIETDAEKLKEASVLDFEEKSVIMDDGKNTDPENQKNREACDAVTQKILGNSVDAETSVEVDNAVLLRDEKAENNIQVESPQELAPELIGQDESCITEDNEKTSSTNEEVNDGTKITSSVVNIDEQVIAGSVTHISPESIEKLNVERSEVNKNMTEHSSGDNNREQVTDDNSIRCLALESVEQGPVKNIEEDFTGEISEKSDTAEANESIEHGTIKNMESPKDNVDASTVKGDTLQIEERNPTPTETVPEEKGNDFEPADVKDNIENKTSKFEEDLEHISQKNEPEETLPQSLSTTSDKKEAFNTDAGITPGDMEEGPTQNIEEALQIEEEKEAEAKSDTEGSKTATEDLEKIAETSDSSKSKESMVSETSSEMDKMMVEDEIRKEEPKIYEESNDGSKDQKIGKHNIKEECSTTDILQDPIGEKTLQFSYEDEKEEETPKLQAEDDEKHTLELEKIVEQSREVEKEKIERSSQEDDKDAKISKQGNDSYISPLSTEVEEEKIEQISQEDEKVIEISNQGSGIEQETIENSEGDVNKTKLEGDNNGQQTIEENNSRDLISKSDSVSEELEKEMKSNLPHHTDSDLLEIELNEKTECEEVEAPNKNANDLHNIQALDEEAGQTEGKNLEVFNSEPKGTIQQAYEAYTEEEKRIDDAPEAYQSSNSTIFEHTSIEEAESTELVPRACETDTEKLKEASRLDFEGKSVIMDDGENTDREMQKNREAYDAVTQEMLANSVDAGTLVEVDNAVLLRDKTAEKNMQVEIPLELAPELTGQEESCIAEDNEKTSSTNEEVNSGAKISGSIVTIDEQVIAGIVIHSSPESIEKPNVESSEGNKNMVEHSSGDKIREQVTADNSIRCLALESDTAEATESNEHETIKNMESLRDIVDASMVKGDTLQTEGRNPSQTETVAEEKGNDFKPVDVKDDIENKTSKFEEDLEHISQKNEPEEKLPRSLSTTSDKKEAFNTDADITLSAVEKGPTQNLGEALQIEEEKEAEAKIDTKDSKTATEDLEKIVESNSSKSKESMVSEPNSEMDKLMVEDKIKKEEPEEIYKVSNDGGKDEETEKHSIKEECSTTAITQEPTGEKPLQISYKDEKEEETPKLQAEDDKKQTLELEKNVEQSKEVEEVKIERSSQEDDKGTEISKKGNDLYISPLSREVEEEKIEQSSQDDEKVIEISNQGNGIRQETLENSEGNVNKAKSEGENNGQQTIEENNSRGLIPESKSVEQSPVKSLEAHKMEADKFTREIFENSGTLGTTEPESNEHETSTTIESTAEVLDTSQMKQGDRLQKEDNQLTAVESLAEDKRNEDKGPAMLAEESSENELLAAKDNSETKPPIFQEDSQHIPQEIEPEENHQQSFTVISNENEAYISNADKTPYLMEVLTSQDLNEASWKGDNDKETEEKNDTKDKQKPPEENPELVVEPSDASKSTEGIVSELKSEKDQMLIQDEIKREEPEEVYDDSKNTSLREATEDKPLQNFEEEGKEEDTPIPEACVDLEISVGKDAEKQITEGTFVEQPKELEVEKVEQIYKEDDITAQTSKQEECETTQTANEDEDTGSQNIEKGSVDEHKFAPLARGIDDKQAFEAEALSARIEKQDIEKHLKQGASSSWAEEDNVEEISKEDKSTAMKLKDQLYEDSNDGRKVEETEHKLKEECITTHNLSEPIGEELFESSNEDEKEEETPEIQASEEFKTTSSNEDAKGQILKVEKNIDRSREVEEEEIEQRLQEDDTAADLSKQNNDTYISPMSNEQEALENSDGNKDKEEKSVEESNSTGLIPESVEHSPVKSFEDDKTREDKSSGEIFENSKTSGVAEIAAHETSTTFENTAKIKNLNAAESSAEEKRNEDRCIVMLTEENSNDNEPITAEEYLEKKSSIGGEDLPYIQQENEPEEKHNRLLFVMSNENEAETSEDLDEAPKKEDSDRETEEKNDTKDNKIATEENHEIVAESSDASKSTEVLDLKAEEDKMPVHDETKDEEAKELYEATKNAVICDTEDIVQHSKQDAYSSLVEKGHLEENLKEDESTPMKSKYQVGESNSLVEDAEAPSSAEGTVSETSKDGEESKVNSCTLGITKESEAETLPNETNGNLTEVSARVLHTSNKETGEEIKEKGGTAVDDSDAAHITVVAEEKRLHEAKPEDKKLVESFAPSFEEKDIAEIETKETMLESIDINVKPHDTSELGKKRDNEIPTVADKAREITEGLIQESAMVSHTSNKETEEEIKETEETTTEDSDFASVAVTDAKGLQEAESEDQKQLESFVPGLEDKAIAETEIKERALGSVDINVKPEDKSDLDEKRVRGIPKVVDDDRETIDGKVQNDASHGGSEYQSEETAEVTETVHKPPAQEEVPFENTETACVAQAKDEMFMNKQDDITNPVNVSELESVDIRKETANEEVHKHKIEDLDSAKSLSTSEDVEITKGEEAGKLADQDDVCKSTTLKDFESSNLELQMEKTEDEKPFNEAMKTSETSGICTRSENVILEQEIFKDNLKEVVRVEDAAIEQRGDALPDELEVTETKTSKKFPESDKSQIEENSNNNQNQEDDKGTKEKEEPQLEAEEHKEQNVNETTKTVILTEKEQNGVEQSNDNEDIKEMVIEEPQDRYNKIDNASMTAETDIISGKSEIDEKLVKVFKIDSDEPCLEVTEAANFPEDKEFDSMELEEETSEMAERDGVIIENRDAGEAEETKMASEKSKGQNAEEAEVGKSQTVENPGPDEVEETKIVANEVNEIKEVSGAVYESKDQGTKEAEVEESQTVEKPDQLPTHNDDHAEKVYAAMENSDADETKVVSNSVNETNDQGAEETEMDHIPSGYFEHAQKESVAEENPKVDQVNEIKVASDATYEFKDQETVESTAEIPAVEKLDQVPAANSEHAEEETVTVQYPDAEEFEETKIDSILECKSKDDVTGENKTEAKPDAEKIEEACKAASDYRAPVTENEITAHQAPSAEKSNSQLPTPSSVNKIQEEELSMETAEKATTSTNIGNHVAVEDRCTEQSNQVRKESFPDEFERKEVGDSEIKLDPKSLREESIHVSGNAETTTAVDEGSTAVISQKDRKMTQETGELEQSPCETTEKQIPTEADLTEYAPTLEQQGITETPQKAEVGDLEPGNTKVIPSEEKLDLEAERTTEESALMDSAKASLSDLLPRSRNVTMEVDKNVSEGRETTASTEENQIKKAEAIHVEEAKMDEDSSSVAAAPVPVMAEASRDVVDVKVAHKKSHNILSGVGSKVKHSISKVKKAIIGKSSHPKAASPK